MIMEITEQNFEQEVMQSDKPVLIDFWAVWCGPCSMLSPVVDEIAGEMPEIKVGKVNVDEQPALGMKYGINAIPTLVLMNKGEFVKQLVGVYPKEAIVDMIKEVL